MKGLIVVMVVMMSTVLCGCATDQGFVKAVDGYTKVILPEYKGYIQSDQNLSEDSKRIRLQTADKFQQLVDEAKEK
jgi:hypothetical protein